MKKPYAGMVPFDKVTGDLLRGDWYCANRELRPNYEFKAAMRVCKWFATASSAAVEIEPDAGPPGTGPKYYMFMSEFMELVQAHTLAKGVTPVINWTFHRKGVKYGIRPVKP